VFSGVLQAQEPAADTLSRQEIRKRKQAKKAAKIHQQFLETYQILLDSSFVLEAEYLSGYQAGKVPVKFMINFIMVDSAKTVMQYGFDGWNTTNGAGGGTLTGTIDSYQLTADEKHGTFSIVMKLSTMAGAYDVNFLITSSCAATAWVSGPWVQLTFEGRLVQRDRSSVFVGQTL
jgi:hypothetical protein